MTPVMGSSSSTIQRICQDSCDACCCVHFLPPKAHTTHKSATRDCCVMVGHGRWLYPMVDVRQALKRQDRTHTLHSFLSHHPHKSQEHSKRSKRARQPKVRSAEQMARYVSRRFCLRGISRTEAPKMLAPKTGGRRTRRGS